MHRSRVILAVTASSALCASVATTSVATAQDAAAKKIPITKLGAAEARTAESVGAITSMRALSNGTVLLNDFPQRRVVMLDGALKQVKVLSDTLNAPIPYGQRQPGLMPFLGDSSVLVDPATLAMLVLNPKGEVTRIMSVPRPQDINTLASANFGTNAFDSKGQLIYRAQAGFGGGGMNFGGGAAGGPGGRGGNQGGQGGQGGAQGGGRGGAGGAAGGRGGAGGGAFGGGFGGGEDFPGGGRVGGDPNQPGGRGGRGGQNNQPDSVPILRANFDTRKTDTVTFVRVPKNEFATQPTPEGGTRVITKINPLPQADDWALLSDGTVAVVRVLDYHVDWYGPDKKHTASAKLPFDWKALDDSMKTKIIDSLKAAADVYTKAAAAQTQGGNANRIAFEPIAAEKLPDFYPPIRQGTTHADADGNLWILPATSTISANDFINAATGGGRGGRGGAGGGGFGGAAGGAGGAGGDRGGAGGGAAGAAGGAAGDRGGRANRGGGGGDAGAAAAGGAAGAAGGAAGGRGGLEALLPQQPVVSLNYDVVNRAGELIERVQLPPGRTIAGFGPNGTIYLTVREGRNVFMERYKRP